MYSRIPTAKFETGRSPLRSQGRSPSSSPGKSPTQRGERKRGSSPMRNDSPEKSGQSPSQGHLSRSLKPRNSFSKSQSPHRMNHGPTTKSVRVVSLNNSPEKSPGKSKDNVNGKDSYKAGIFSGSSQPGVRYITEELIRKISKQDRIEFITSLNLTLAKESGRKIKYIENLDNLRRVQVLNLSCNMIEKIENLEKLSGLREINLSYNNISKLDGLECLTSLQVLNLTGNCVEHLPQWIGKKLKSLRNLKLAKNEIQSIQEFTKLRPLKDLTQLTVAENPVTQLPHCRPFLVFHLRTLESLDSQPISMTERTEAHNRFAQEEIEKLEYQLEQQQQMYNKLKDDHNRSLGEVEAKDNKVRSVEEQAKVNREKVKELERILETKEALLKRKTMELTKACEKHYALEQELAFYKIDHKFGELAKPPRPATSDSDTYSADDGLIGGESPYLGKGRFRKGDLAHHKHHNREMKGESPGNRQQGDCSGEGRSLSFLDVDEKAQLNETMDKELAEKHEAIEKAQQKLQLLHTDLQLTQEQLQQATEELHRISEVAPARPLTEDDKQDLRNLLARKMNKVHHLRGEASKLEDEMKMTQDDLDEQEQEVNHLRSKLKRMGSRDSLYNLVKKEVAEKERKLSITTQQYVELQRQLESMICTIARETEDIKKLEQELRDGQIVRNDELRAELETIVEGLQAYLKQVQEKADEQKQEHDKLFKEKIELLETIRNMEYDREMMEEQAAEISALREKLNNMEESLQEHQELNESLQKQLDESRIQERNEAELDERLREAEHTINHLKNNMRELEKKAAAEREGYEKRLEANQKKLDQLKNRAREANMKEDEIRNLHSQLTNLQMANAGLQDQIYALSEKLKEERGKALNPDLLRQRLEDMAQLLASRGYRDKHHPDQGADDPIEMIDELNGEIQNVLDKSFREVEKAKRDRDMAKSEAVALRDQVTQVQDEERQRAEMAIQAMMDEERDEAERLRRQIDRLKAELERERQLNREQALITAQLMVPSTRSSQQRTSATVTTTATGTTTATESSEEETSTIPSSQWSQKKREIYDMMSPEEQELFDELQKEIEELRKLLMMKGKNKDAIKKANQAAQTAALLREMIETRHSSSGRDTRHSHSGASTNRTSHHEGAHVAKLAKASGDPRMQKLGEELDQAQQEIDHLRANLRTKNHQIKDEMMRTNRSQFTVATQQQEIEQLHTLLDEQRQELENLTKLIDDTELAGSRVAPEGYLEHGEMMSRMERGPTRHQPIGHSNHFVDKRGHHIPPDEMAAPYGGDSVHADEYAHRQKPRGRPVPTFYSPDGEVVAFPDEDYYSNQRGASAANTYNRPEQGRQHVAFGPDGGIYNQVSQAVGVAPPVTAAYNNGSTTTGYTNSIHTVSGLNGQQSMQTVAMGPQGRMANQGAASQRGGFVGAGMDAQGQPAAFGIPQQQGPAGMNGPSMPGIQNVVPGAPGVVPTASGMIPSAVPVQGVTGAGQPVQYMHTPQGPSTHAVIAAGQMPTTPVAGLNMGMVAAGVNTPGGTMVQPMMMSTPMTGGVDDLTASPIKGILKKVGGAESAAGTEEGGLWCNVPEHHDLEDYVSKLQTKIRSMKSKLRDGQDSTTDDGRHVLFEEDIEKQTVRRLQAELEERRRDLESLDLAIERQKSHLHKLNKEERKLQMKRELAKKELEKCRHRSQSSRSDRQAFLDGDLDLSISESDQDYEYLPSGAYRGRKEYIQQEILCLEETLARRRAELREADRLLTECEMDLADARKQAKDTVEQYQQARKGVITTLQDAEELEQRAYDAGVKLIRAEEELERVKLETAEVKDEKAQYEKMMADIETVISKKDAEFRSLDSKIKEASEKFHDIQFDLHTAENQQKEHLAMLKESDQILAEKRQELNNVIQQISSVRLDHETLNKLIEQERSELSNLEEIVRKRRIQLDSIDHDVSTEVKARQHELQAIENELVGFRQTRKELGRDIKQARAHVEQQKQIFKHIMGLLRKRKAELSEVEGVIKVYYTKLKSLKSELVKKCEIEKQLNKHLKEEEAELEKLQAECHKRATEADALYHKMSAHQDEIQALKNEKHSLEDDISTLQRDKGFLDEKIRDMQKVVADLKRTQTQIEDEVHTGNRTLASLEQEVKGVENVLNSTTRDPLLSHQDDDGSRSAQEAQSCLHEAEDILRRLDHRDGDQHGRPTGSLSTLEGRVRNLADEIIKREQEKLQLTTALNRSVQDLHKMRGQLQQERDEMGQRMRHLESDVRGLRQEIHDRNKELQHLRTKTANEIADLEGIAQAHCSRANRLSDELSYLRAEYLEVKRQLDSQQEIAERERRLEETIQDLKSDIKFEVADTLMEKERCKAEIVKDLELMQDQKEDLTTDLCNLKQSLTLIHSEDGRIHASTDSLKDSLFEHQNFLKQQLEQKMLRQAEMIAAQRQISQENLLQLQQKLTSIEQVYSQSENNISPASESMVTKLNKSHDMPPLTSNEIREEKNSSQESSSSGKDVPKRAYSPYRYSNHRSPRHANNTQVAEKDLSS